MAKDEKMLLIVKALADKKIAEDAVKLKYQDKNKVKRLNQDERLLRIEEILGIV